MKELEIFKLEERVLFEAAAAAEIIAAADMAQGNTDAVGQSIFLMRSVLRCV